MPKVAIFVSDRIFRTSSGRICTSNRRIQGLEWEQLGVPGQGQVLCARMMDANVSTAEHIIKGDVRGLPYFQGVRAAFFKFPALLTRSVSIVREVDLVVVKGVGIVGIAGVIAARLQGKPLAIHLVGDIEDVLLKPNPSKKDRMFSMVGTNITKWAVRQASAVRYPTKRYLQSKYPASSREKEFFFTDASVVPIETPPASPDFVPGRIVAIGSQERPYKGHGFLIRALPQIKNSVPHAHLILVGQGIHQKDLKKLTEDLNLTDSVTFIDFLNGWEAVSTMMNSANVFAMPSITEGLPRALLEAMSLGVACVGSEVAGIPELLPEDLLVPRSTVTPLADLIIRLLTSEERRRKAALVGLANSHDFSQEAMEPRIKQWNEELDALAKRS